MNWFSSFLSSSIGQKILMSLTGIFLMLFLVIHLIGNFQLLASDQGKSFNIYTYFMTHNPMIVLISYVLYASILLHSIQGSLLWLKNRKAKGPSYAVKSTTGTNLASRYMMHLGLIIFIFLIIHLWQFWLQMKLGNLPMLTYPESSEHQYKDLYTLVQAAYSNIYYVLFYVVCMIFLGFHLAHGFASAFQSLGMNHKKYTPIIRFIGLIYSILIPIGFAILPIYMYLVRS
ncbi:MAG: succinate dehydrogenase cytochrome b subunit [Bacteroidota bacterium]|nr:succinate dehydrogenase cytochrome b subunit [Bacteroidota bacterium]